MATTQPLTKVTETLAVKGLTVKTLTEKIGRALGSPINGKEIGQQFDITLTGKIEIREFQGNKGAYFTSKEGYSVRVNASFDPKVHVENATMKCICRELKTDDRTIKFCAFVD